MNFIILGVAFIISLVGIFVLYKKLTPNKIPDNLARHFARALKLVLAIVVAGFAVMAVLIFIQQSV